MYKALKKSCSKHTTHRTRLCLEAKSIWKTTKTPQIRFTVAFGRFTLQHSASSALVFFAIESTVPDALHVTGLNEQTNVTSVVASLKRTVEALPQEPPKRIKKSVRFSNAGHVTLYASIPDSPTSQLSNLCMNQNFCDRLKAGMKQCPDGDRYIGWLDDTEGCRHLVRSLCNNTTTARPASSLCKIMSLSSNSHPLARLSHFERLHLASSLAIAVLRYSNTPWLKHDQPWRSEDIYFFNAEERTSINGAPKALSEPHIDVAVDEHDAAPSSNSSQAEHLAPNIALFNLAVILIELAFNTNFQNLLSPAELSSKDLVSTRFRAAKRLTDLVSREMGLDYSTIVRKCLHCSFASGCDLSNVSLQREYYQDVVEELESLENSFRAIELGT